MVNVRGALVGGPLHCFVDICRACRRSVERVFFFFLVFQKSGLINFVLRISARFQIRLFLPALFRCEIMLQAVRVSLFVLQCMPSFEITELIARTLLFLKSVILGSEFKTFFMCYLMFTPTLFSSFGGDRGSSVVKAMCCKSEGHWFDCRWCHLNFSLT